MIPWRSTPGGGKMHVTPDIRVYVEPVTVQETVKDRDIPDLYDVVNPEDLADGIPDLVDNYRKAEREHAKWVQQGWWPRPETVQKWQVFVHHRPTRKYFEGGSPFDSEREAVRMAESAIPKIQARRRPRWLVPDPDQEADTMRTARKSKGKTTEVREKKDPNKIKVKVKPSGGRNPHAEDALSRKTTRGHKRKERDRNVAKGHSRKQKHKGRQQYASPSRVAAMYLLGKTENR